MSKKPPPAEATEGFGSDSFLDVVANMVGILIILIMVAGLRARDAVVAKVETPAPVVEESVTLKTQASQLKADVEKVFDQAKELSALAAQREEERNLLALMAAAKKADLDERKATLASAEREGFDLQQAAERERIRLAHLERDLADSVEQPKEVVQIKMYPTPLGRTVYGRESHFQLKDNRITYVPIDELVDLVKDEVQRKIHRARDLDQFTETVGPIGNFRLRYVIERVSLPAGSGPGGAAGTFIGVTQLTFLPVQTQLGETLEEALRPQSDFQRALADLDARRVTITFWTYPDSFTMYRTLREKLYQRGYAIAGRPLQHGQPISGSPFGSKSSAQ
jgi:hypothetical protein